MLSSPRKPPAKTLSPLSSTRLTHHVKLSSSRWNALAKKLSVPFAGRAGHLVDAPAGPGVDRRIDVVRSAKSYAGNWPLGCMYHSRRTPSSCRLANSGSMRAIGIM